jgi:type I restriction enzyme M protein
MIQLQQLESDFWAADVNLRANSDLKTSEYSALVHGHIFLKFADTNYPRHEEAILVEFKKLESTRREKPLHEIAIARCEFYQPAHAGYGYLLNLAEDQDIAKAIKVRIAAKALIERLTQTTPKVLVQERYRDNSTRIVVRDEVGYILDEHLPVESYDKQLFVTKRDQVFELALNLAINHRKWAA